MSEIRYAGGIYGCGEDDASLRLRQRGFLAKVGKTARESHETPTPRIDHGRWLVDCPCGSGAGISTASKAYCFECGRIMTVSLPAKVEREEAEAVLSARPLRARNWRPDRESVNDLKRERAR